MKFFEFLKKGDTIGLVAPSCGIASEPYLTRFNSAIKKLQEYGLKFKYNKRIFNHDKFVSNSPKVRADEFMEMWLDDSVKGIMSVAGGEFMMEILPYIDFEKIKNSKPKFFQGFSDNTNLTFTLTTLCDIVSIYGNNFPSFGLEEYHQYQTENLKFLFGENNKIVSTPYFEEKETCDDENFPLRPYGLTGVKDWSILSGEKQVEFSGRMLGGCLDILVMLCGTKFDKVKEYLERYKEDGFVWFIESCDLDARSILRGMWQLKNAGWFKYCKGFVIGKPLHTEEMEGVTYFDAFYRELKDLNVPVVIDANFGHVKPLCHMVSGTMGTITCDGKGGTIQFDLK